MNPAASHVPPSDSAVAAVLVVEDNDTTRDRIATLLRSRGYEVAEAIDGLEALRKVSRRKFDAIVLDLVLPNFDGWQFRAMQLRHPEMSSIPTVIVSVQPLRAPERYSLRTTDVLQKPFEDANLLQAVERARQTRQPMRLVDRADAERVSVALFWSNRGEIACVDHAPDATSQRWRQERWAAIPASTGERRVVYCCQHCPGNGSPIDRSRRSSRRSDSPAAAFDRAPASHRQGGTTR